MIAPDDDRGLDLARSDELVDRQPRAGAVAVAEPADPRRQTLERDALRRKLQPTLKQRVVREQSAQHAVDRRDVPLIAGQCDPTKWADATTEERPDIGRDEARV